MRDNCFVSLKCTKAVQNFEHIGSNKEVFMKCFPCQNTPQWGRATLCMRLYGYNCLSFKCLQEIYVVTQRKTGAWKSLGVFRLSSTVWAMYWMEWWTSAHMNGVIAWPV